MSITHLSSENERESDLNLSCWVEMKTLIYRSAARTAPLNQWNIRRLFDVEKTIQLFHIPSFQGLIYSQVRLAGVARVIWRLLVWFQVSYIHWWCQAQKLPANLQQQHYHNLIHVFKKTPVFFVVIQIFNVSKLPLFLSLRKREMSSLRVCVADWYVDIELVAFLRCSASSCRAESSPFCPGIPHIAAYACVASLYAFKKKA